MWLRPCRTAATTAACTGPRPRLEAAGRLIDVSLDANDRKDDDGRGFRFVRDRTRHPRSALDCRKTDDRTHIAFPRPDGRIPQLGSCPRFEARKVNGPLTGGS